MFQQLLDVMDNQSTSIYRNLIAAAQRFAGASGLYPTCYELDSVADTGVYECSGGFADVFSKEALLWGQLHHPNVLSFYGTIYRIKDRISFVAPWMDNGTVAKFLKQEKNSNRVLLGNILVNECGRACVADFGLSSVSDKEILAWTSYSAVASKGGTVRWQAPELFNLESNEEVNNTKASDIYAWAFVAYEKSFPDIYRACASGSPNPRYTIIHKVSGGERPRRPPALALSWTVWGLSGDIWKLMETCWDADPAQRPKISLIVETLEMALPKDAQRDAPAISISPSQFRAMTRNGLEEADGWSMDVLSRALHH
ncbi:hypothetical protein H0H92_012157 [Tricholoma furcatifolium]|nr:hypothetical protein H0H92_012157 [Tricholoma furcatifolium]